MPPSRDIFCYRRKLRRLNMELVKEVTPEVAITQNFKLIDVRTKSEFEEFHIPGAINIPLFSEEKRKEISKVYYSEGERSARLLALKLVAPKLPKLVEEIRKVKEKHSKIAVYCWRGGMRSLSVVTICNLCGLGIYRLKGGYRAFRKFMLKDLEEILKDKKAIVIYGKTGTGKTRLLKKLKSDGFPVVDLEELAGHRGSVFGGIGLKQKSQKMFDSLIWFEVRKMKASKYFIVEGESKKIGKVYIPEAFWNFMQSGINVEIEIPIEERIKISIEDYKVSEFSPQTYLGALHRIRKILGEEKFRTIAQFFEEEKYEQAVRELMVNYYDKLYERSTPEIHYAIKAENFDLCYERVKKLIKEICGSIF
jgi:tRNA 2-selenouridine synthase